MTKNNLESKELALAEKQTISQAAGEPTREGVLFVPQVDIEENQDAIIVRADLPGVQRENVSIDVENGTLTLTAQVTPQHRGKHLLYQEYRVGGYQRRFTLGEKIDQANIEASMELGVLTLTLPKAPELKPRKITIQGA